MAGMASRDTRRKLVLACTLAGCVGIGLVAADLKAAGIFVFLSANALTFYPAYLERTSFDLVRVQRFDVSHLLRTLALSWAVEFVFASIALPLGWGGLTHDSDPLWRWVGEGLALAVVCALVAFAVNVAILVPGVAVLRNARPALRDQPGSRLTVINGLVLVTGSAVVVGLMRAVDTLPSAIHGGQLALGLLLVGVTPDGTQVTDNTVLWVVRALVALDLALLGLRRWLMRHGRSLHWTEQSNTRSQ
jgi:hypothetical protein